MRAVSMESIRRLFPLALKAVNGKLDAVFLFFQLDVLAVSLDSPYNQTGHSPPTPVRSQRLLMLSFFSTTHHQTESGNQGSESRAWSQSGPTLCDSITLRAAFLGDEGMPIRA